MHPESRGLPVRTIDSILMKVSASPIASRGDVRACDPKQPHVPMVAAKWTAALMLL
jgi:hypothetical protein